jgi:hypothetical protein
MVPFDVFACSFPLLLFSFGGYCIREGNLVFLPGFQKGRDIDRLLKEKGREQFWPKKGQFASYKEKPEKLTEFTT